MFVIALEFIIVAESVWLHIVVWIARRYMQQDPKRNQQYQRLEERGNTSRFEEECMRGHAYKTG